jgi:mono/diheme cytochrome c family protein
VSLIITRQTRLLFFVFAMGIVMALVMLAGCKHDLPPGKPDSELTPSELHGKKLFVARCAACHDATTTKPFHGPGLAGLMGRPYLPSGAPANDERVQAVIVRGRTNMPAFGNSLDDLQIRDLMAYLHTL